MTRPVPQIFDWVTARSQCALDPIFAALCALLESDVAKIAAIRPRLVFKAYRATEDTMVISATRDLGGALKSESVIFTRLADHIDVKAARTQRTLFTARPALDGDGACRLMIEGESTPRELWQVSQKALDGVFFDGYR